MNRITNKEYLIDITIKTLETQQPTSPTKVKCEIHYGDDSYLRIQVQPLLRNGVAQFCDERLRIPFSSEVDLVFKLIKSNKRETFLGHYSLQVEKMLSEKQYNFKVKDRLEESQAWVDFQCRIIDKQLLCQSDTEQPQIQNAPNIQDGISNPNITTFNRIKFKGPLSELGRPLVILKKTAGNHIPLPPEQYGKLLREAEDIMTKRQIFSQRHQILSKYSRNKYGKLQTQNILSLQHRLNQFRREKFTSNMVIYIIVSVIAFLLGMQL